MAAPAAFGVYRIMDKGKPGEPKSNRVEGLTLAESKMWDAVLRQKMEDYQKAGIEILGAKMVSAKEIGKAIQELSFIEV